MGRNDGSPSGAATSLLIRLLERRGRVGEGGPMVWRIECCVGAAARGTVKSLIRCVSRGWDSSDHLGS
jgi:hypothetical protein